MTAETMTITGILRRSKQRKSPRNWIAAMARREAEDVGLVTARYYPETGYVEGDTLNTLGRQPNVWSLASLKAFDDLPSGTRVRFTASVERWDNGNGHSLGGTCRRVRNVEVLPPVEVVAEPVVESDK